MNQVEYKYRKVLEYLQLNGPTSKSQIARALNTSFMTVNTIVNRILAGDLVSVCGKSYGNSGRSPELFKIRPGLAFAVGLAVRTDRVFLSAVDSGGTTTARSGFPVADPEILRSIRQMSSFLAQCVRSFLANSGIDGAPSVVGVTMDGVIDFVNGVALQMRDSELIELDVRSGLQEALGIPVVVEDTGRVLAYLSWKTMDGLRPHSLLFMRIDTEISCGLMIGGRVYRGSSGLAGRIGHIKVGDAEARCGCGSTGCLETVASSTSVLSEARRLAASGAWHPAGTESGHVTLETIRRSAENGDTEARALIRRCGNALGTALLWLVHAYNPDLILLGGGISRLGAFLVKDIETLAAGHLTQPFRHILRFAPVEHIEFADSRAAAVHALDCLFDVGPDLQSPNPIGGAFVSNLVKTLLG